MNGLTSQSVHFIVCVGVVLQNWGGGDYIRFFGGLQNHCNDAP